MENGKIGSNSLSLVKRAGKNIFFKFLAEIIIRLLSLIFFAFIARKLGDEDFGKYSFAYSFTGILVIIMDMGLNTILIRDIARDKTLISSYGGNIISLKFALALLTILLIFILIKIMHYPPQIFWIVIIFGLIMVFNAFLEYFTAIFNAIERMEYETILKGISKLLIVILGIGSLGIGYDLWGLVKALLIGYLLSFFLGFFLVIKKVFFLKPLIDFSLWKYLLKRAFPLALTTIFMTIYSKVDVVLLSLIRRNNAEIGWYSAPTKLIEMLGLIPFLVVGGIFPIFSSLNLEQKELLKRLYEKSFHYLLTLAIPMAVGIIILSPQFILAIYGEKFYNSAAAFRILGPSLLFIFVNYVLTYLLVALDKEKKVALAAGLSLMINLGFNFLLIPYYGYLGASFAYLVTVGFLFSFCFYQVSQQFLRLNLRENLVKPLLSGLGMGIVLFYLRNFSLGFTILVGAISYLVFLFLLRTFNSTDFFLMKKVFK